MPVIRVVTYNIQHGCDLAGSLDLNRCLRELADLKPDIVALQEIDRHRWSTRLQDQVRFMAGKMGMRYAYGAVRNYRPGSYGNAILSRFPIQYTANHIMTPDTDRRCCLEAGILVGKTAVKVLAVHLGLKSADRVQQVQTTIIPLVQGVEQPYILAGDFNASAGYREILIVKDNMEDSFAVNSGKEQNTFPSDRPTIRIDYIFTANCQAGDCRIISPACASDHLPVLADIYLP
ncbi:MAG: endonuclease/exonuclease/phosphatase family protein [Deltaproteobacteria bacterium]